MSVTRTVVLACFMALLASCSSGAQATPESTPLTFPAATPWGRVKPERKYDAMTDTTRVWLTVDAFRELGSIDVTSGFSFAGKAQMRNPSVITLLISVSSDAYSDDQSHTNIKRTVQADTKTPILFLLKDGTRLRLDGQLADNDVRVYWGGATRTSVAYIAAIPIVTYLQIVNSAPDVKVRAGDTDFTLNSRSIGAMRNFAGHMTPVRAMH